VDFLATQTRCCDILEEWHVLYKYFGTEILQRRRGKYVKMWLLLPLCHIGVWNDSSICECWAHTAQQTHAEASSLQSEQRMIIFGQQKSNEKKK
jgi:hypothetical protein